MSSALKFSAHIGYLYTEMPLEARVGAAAAAGFPLVEHPQPFSIGAKRMRELLSEHRVSFAQLAAGTGDASKGEKGLAALPGRTDAFRDAFNRALEYAIDIAAPLIHPMAGVPSAADAERWEDVYMANIQYAVERTRGTGVTVLIEAISDAAVSGYAISTLDQAMKVQDAFGRTSVTLLVDTYHARASGIDAADWLETNVARAGHIHVADHPGRHEPGTGKIDFDRLLTVLADRGFSGAIGFEYIPSTTTAESLSFLPGWQSRS